MSSTKSPLPGVPDQQTYERLLQGLGASDVYRQIPQLCLEGFLSNQVTSRSGKNKFGKGLSFVPSCPQSETFSSFFLPPPPAAAYYLPRHLTPNPAYPHPYPYLIRGFPDTAALENRQTLFNDYITSQQMHQWPPAAAAAMAAQRSELLRGLTPRDQPLPLPYSAAPRGRTDGFLAPFHIKKKKQHNTHSTASLRKRGPSFITSSGSGTRPAPRPSV